MKVLLELLNENDVALLTKLIEKLDESSFASLQIEVGELKIAIGKGETLAQPHIIAQASKGVKEPPRAQVNEAAAAIETEKNPNTQQPPPEQAEDLVAITATTVGIFYAQSEPGAPPYVKVGDVVEKDTTVGLIEIMKVYSAIPAGIRGKIAQICVENGQFVEYGQPLFYVEPL